MATMSDSATEDRLAMLQIYCERRGLQMVVGSDQVDQAMHKIELILGELVCELDMIEAGLKMAGRGRK